MSQEEGNGQVWPPSHEPAPGEPDPAILTGEAAAFGSQSLTVQKCAACDGKHESIAMNEYTRAPAPFTHWYKCPTIGDPVPVALAMMQSGGAMELNGPVCQHLAAAQVSGQYMVVVAYRDENGKLRMNVNQNKFPTGDYFETKEIKGVMGMLREILEREAGTVQQQAMRAAAIPKPLRDLLGTAQPSNKQEFKIPEDLVADSRARDRAQELPPQQ